MNVKDLKKIFLVLVSSSVLFIFILNINQNRYISSTTLFFIALLIVFFVSCLILSINIVNPFMFFFVYYFLGTWDVVASSLNLRNTKLIWNTDIYQKALFIIVVWFFSFTVGYFLITKIKKNDEKKRDTIIKFENQKRFSYVLIPLLIISIYVFSNIFKGASNITSLINAPLVGEGKLAEGKGFTLAFTYIIGLIPVVLVAAKKKKLGVISSLIIFGLMILTGRRSMSFKAAFIPLLVFWNFREKEIKKKWLVIGGGLATLVVSLVGMLRTINQTDFSFTNVQNGALSQFIILGKYVGYGDNLVDLVGKIDTGQIPFQKFNFVFRGIQYIIPRSLWANKPSVHSGEIVSNLIYFSGDVGRPVGSFGWAYLQFGVWGVILSGLITGIVVNQLYLWAIKRNDLFSLGMYGLIILPMLELFLPESQMLIIINLLLWVGIFMVCPLRIQKEGLISGNNEKNFI